MRTSLFSQSLLGLNLGEAARLTAQAGYSAIEIACTSPHLSSEEARRNPGRAARSVEQSGLSVSALSLYNSFTDQASLDDEIELAKFFIGLAPLFNTTVVKLTPGPPASAEATPEHWRCLQSATQKLIPAAQEAGVRLAFETHMRQLSDTLASSMRLIEIASSDVVGLTVDFSNLAFAGEDMREVISLLKGRILNTHVKNGYIDETGGWHFQRLDEGLTNYDVAIPMLREIGYDAYLTVECLGPETAEYPYETIHRDLEILTRYLDAIDVDTNGGLQ